MHNKWIGLLSLPMGLLLAVACGGGSSYSSSAATATPPVAKTAAAVPAHATTIKVAQAGSLGQILTTADGRTLYVFLKDTPGSGKSACSGGCAQAWPPLTLASGDPVKADGMQGTVSLVTRDDGTKQVAYNGQPLYTYANDAAPGDTKGQGVGNNWFVVPPGTSPVTGPAAAAASPASATQTSAYGSY